MKEFQEDKERKHEWDSDALDERPESVSDVFDQQDEALKEGDSPPVEKPPESVSDIFTKQIEALKEGNLTLDHIWEGNSSPLENVSEKKSKAKEIWKNLTEEGKRLELVVKAELKKRHEQTQELDQLHKIIESSAKVKVKELKIQELTLSQEGQRLQELVKTIREHHAQDKDGDFLDKLFSQVAEKTTDAVTKIFEKADDSTKQTIQLASNKLDKALFTPPEKSNPPESSQAVENRGELELSLGQKKSKKVTIEENSSKIKYDWQDPSTLKLVEDWITGFAEQNGRSPYLKEVIRKFRGFFDYLKRENLTYNKFLEARGHSLNRTIYDWQDPSTLRLIEDWITDFAKQNGRSPYQKEVIQKFGGFGEYLKRENLTYNKFLEAWGHSLNRTDWQDPSTVRLVEDWITSFAKQNGRSPYLKEVLKKFGGFFDYLKRENLTYNKFLEERGFKVEYNWRDPFTIKLVKNWIEYFIKQNGRTPLLEEVRQEFGGFGHYLKREKVSYNDFLKKGGHSPNIEFEYDWQDPNTLKLVENWISDFTKKNGRSPYLEDLRNEFRGFRNHLRRKKLTYNEFLKTRGYFPNLEFEYNWQDPNTIKLMENWIASFVKEFGEPPSLREIEKKFGGVNYYFKKELLTYNIFLEVHGYSTHKMEQVIEEGVSFDKIGKDCMEILSNSEQFRVFHPITKEFNINYVHPDCIIHNFTKIPFAKTKNNIYLKDGQKFDEIIEIKRSLGSMSIKDWEIYTIIAKRLKIYLLKGSTNLIQEKNGCQIIFYSKNELFHQLRSKITPSNRMKVVNLIKKIQALDKKLDLATIKDLDDY